jgi:hypothetical protein
MALRRPEAVNLFADMLQRHPEAHCSGINPDIAEIESRPRKHPVKPQQKPQQQPAKTLSTVVPHNHLDKPAEAAAKEPEKKIINPVMIGRLPRRNRER